ncbi:MAG: DNA N-6-adenine-methyltransferase [Bradyrhizobium sp.]|uniref:DNA N-6-adenine-methyltransferase n=1 Tax=Bradyrhizobium sp. TaxID=376 RepID=UPI003D0E28F9
MAQHNSKTPVEDRDEWRTPPWLFEWLDDRFDFHIDLAATRGNALCPLYVTKDGDAMSKDWHEFDNATVGWCNPPYSKIDPWVDKAILEQMLGFTTVMVFPSVNGEERFADIFTHCSEVIDIVGRVHFLRPDGTPVKQNTRGTSVYIFDPRRLGAPCHRWWVMRDKIMTMYGGKAA